MTMDLEASNCSPHIMRDNSSFAGLEYYASLGSITDLLDLYNCPNQDSYGYSDDFIERDVNESVNASGLSRYSPISNMVENLVHVPSNNEFKEIHAISSSLNASGLSKSSSNSEVVENHANVHSNNDIIERPAVIASDLNASSLPTNSKPQITSLKPSGGVKKKRITWTEEEHRSFLLGLQECRPGNWKAISGKYVVTKTPTQVASHAQKYYARQKKVQENPNKILRASIHDTPIPEKSATVEQQHQQTSMPINAQPEEIVDQSIHAPPMAFNPNAKELEDFFRVLDNIEPYILHLE